MANASKGRTLRNAGVSPAGRVLRGVAAAALATAAMSSVLRLFQAAGLFEDEPPRQITSEALRKLAEDNGGGGVPDAIEAPASVLAHVAFGLTVGSVYAVARPALARGIPALPGALRGAGYAILVWFASYQGWTPALGLLPPASRDDRGRQAALVAGHAVYGMVLDRALDPVSS